VGRGRSGREKVGLPPWLYGGSVASLRCARWWWSLGPSLAIPFTLAVGSVPDLRPRLEPDTRRGSCSSSASVFVSLCNLNRRHADAILLGTALRWWLEAEDAGSAGMLLSGSRALERRLGHESSRVGNKSKLLICSRSGVTQRPCEGSQNEGKCHCQMTVGSRVCSRSSASWLKPARSSATLSRLSNTNSSLLYTPYT
jgi:hypothetical protein